MARAAGAGGALESITRVVDEIADMNNRIAGAAEEQSTTAVEINRNVENITDISSETEQGGRLTAEVGEELAGLATRMQELVARFKTAS